MPAPIPDPARPVRALRTADVERVAQALTRAFFADPIYRFLHPRDREWLRAGPRFFAILLRHFASHAMVLTPAEPAAAAIWLPPDAAPPGPLAQLGFSLRLAALLGRRIPRGARVGAALDTFQAEEPHWYLAILGTEPDRQGRGHASSLLAGVLARCDAEGWPARLNTATEANLAFYGRRGFEVIGESVVAGGGPRVWGMRRAPARSMRADRG